MAYQPMKPLGLILITLTLAASSAGFAQTGLPPDDVLIVTYRLFLQKYDVGTPDDRITPRAIHGIRQYQSDWQLEKTGKPSPDLLARLQRQHPDTEPQWHRVENQDCGIWSQHPMARETVTWSGSCVDGKASGEGATVRRFMLQGKWLKTTYKGMRRHGKRHGPGHAIVEHGLLGYDYEGEFENDKLSGKGKIKFALGREYAGEFRDNKPHGRGKYLATNGDRYQGQFERGKRSGEGILQWRCGDRYEGSFSNDMFEGNGVHTYWDGARYRGAYRIGKKNGSGKFTWPDGNRFEGLWRDGLPNGQGTLHDSRTGRDISGNWKNGRLTLNGKPWTVTIAGQTCEM